MRTSRRTFIGTMASVPAILALPDADALATALAVLSRQVATSSGIHGINPADMDFTADPRQDFYRFANGGWLDRVTIPSDRSSYGVFVDLENRATEQLLGLLHNLESSDVLEEGSDEWKAVQLFRQGIDLETRNRQGIEPIRFILDRIQAIGTLGDLHEFLFDASWLGVPHFLTVGVDADLMDSMVNTLYLDGPTLGLPNRDYYLEDRGANEEVRQAYLAMAAELLVHAGHDAATSSSDVQAIYDFERGMAAETLTCVQQQDYNLIYNPFTVAELEETYPLMGWSSYFERLGLVDVTQVIVTEPGYHGALDTIVRETPIETIRDYLAVHTVSSFASYLSEEIEQTEFRYDEVLTGADEQKPLDERVLAEVSGALTDAVGRLYVGACFPHEAKERITELVDELISAFGKRIEATTWMSAETKERAQAKLDKLGVKVGYPDTWQTYEGVEIRDSFAASMISALEVQLRRNFEKYGRPVDRDEWFVPAQRVNAFYNSVANDITFPAAILQPPYFDYQADPASNFGAIGFAIGHEITHGFDQMGSQFDGDGNLSNWWTEEDREAFTVLNQLVADQYSAIEVLPGVFINGQITIGENVADLGGVQVAFDALAAYLEANGYSLDDVVIGPVSGPAQPVAEASPVAALATPADPPAMATPVAVQAVRELTQRERFFIAAATVWRMKMRDEALVTLVQTDPHSPPMVRAVQPIRNMDAFHETWGTLPGDEMFLTEDERVVIW